MSTVQERGQCIDLVEDSASLDAVRALCRDFRLWLLDRYSDNTRLLATTCARARWEAMLAALPQEHARPDGAIMLARSGGEPAGCVMIRRQNGVAAEMKRLFVDARFRGHGIGPALCRAAMDRARADGYRLMRLDTGYRQPEARAMYLALGFTERGPYSDPGTDEAAALVFMERRL